MFSASFLFFAFFRASVSSKRLRFPFLFGKRGEKKETEKTELANLVTLRFFDIRLGNHRNFQRDVGRQCSAYLSGQDCFVLSNRQLRLHTLTAIHTYVRVGRERNVWPPAKAVARCSTHRFAQRLQHSFGDVVRLQRHVDAVDGNRRRQSDNHICTKYVRHCEVVRQMHKRLRPSGSADQQNTCPISEFVSHSKQVILYADVTVS